MTEPSPGGANPPPPIDWDSLPNRTPRELAWHGFQFKLPPGWEVGGFSKSAEKGTLRFQTRAGLQAMLTWRKLPEAPDVARMMTEVHRRALEARARDLSEGLASKAWRRISQPGQSGGLGADEKRDALVAGEAQKRAREFTRLHTSRVGDFVMGYRQEGEPAQASLYAPDTGMILEWLFPYDDPVQRKGAWRALLQSYQPNAGATRRWAIFGLRLRLPEAAQLTDAAAYPANVVLQFQCPGHLGLSARRWGLPAHVREGLDLAGYYRRVVRQLRNKVVDAEAVFIRDAQGRSRPAARVHFERQGEILMDKLAGKWWTGEGLCWEDPDEKRLYAFEQLGPQKTPRLSVSDVFDISDR